MWRVGCTTWECWRKRRHEEELVKYEKLLSECCGDAGGGKPSSREYVSASASTSDSESSSTAEVSHLICTASIVDVAEVKAAGRKYQAAMKEYEESCLEMQSCAQSWRARATGTVTRK